MGRFDCGGCPYYDPEAPDDTCHAPLGYNTPPEDANCYADVVESIRETEEEERGIMMRTEWGGY